MQWRSAGIYFDNKGNLYIIPTRPCPGPGMVESDPWFISSITDEDDIYTKTMKAYEATNNTIGVQPNPTPIEVITGIKKWERAIKDLSVLEFQWSDDEGYLLILNKRSAGGFSGYRKIPLGSEINKLTFKKEIIKVLKNEIQKLDKHIGKEENTKEI